MDKYLHINAKKYIVKYLHLGVGGKLNILGYRDFMRNFQV